MGIIFVNRSIFQIWQPKFCNFIKSFIFSFFIITFLHLFSIIQPTTILCEGDELIRKIVNGVVVRYSRDSKIINEQSIQMMVDHFQNYLSNTVDNHHQFKVLRYWKVWENTLTKVPAYWHYHINLGIPNPWTIHYNIAFTHTPQNYWVENIDYNFFTKKDILGENKPQYVMRDLRIYDLNLLKIDKATTNESKLFDKYIYDNNKEINNFFKKLNKKF